MRSPHSSRLLFPRVNHSARLTHCRVTRDTWYVNTQRRRHGNRKCLHTCLWECSYTFTAVVLLQNFVSLSREFQCLFLHEFNLGRFQDVSYGIDRKIAQCKNETETRGTRIQKRNNDIKSTRVQYLRHSRSGRNNVVKGSRRDVKHLLASTLLFQFRTFLGKSTYEILPRPRFWMLDTLFGYLMKLGSDRKPSRGHPLSSWTQVLVLQYARQLS